MSKSIRPFGAVHRVTLTPADVTALRGHCEATEDVVTVPGGERLRRFTLRGVPGSRVDVCLPAEPRLAAGGRPVPLVLEIGRKVGSFDGHERWRLTVRHWPGTTHRRPGPRECVDGVERAIPAGRLLLDRREAPAASLDAPEGVAADFALEAGSTVTAAVLWAGGAWSETWPCLPSDLTGYDLAAVVMWHRERYYQHVPYDEARALADSFEASHPGIRAGTLAEANRLASRGLYRLARDLGWRKLTLRERQKYALDAQWVRIEKVEARRAELGYPSGIGQYTAEAASGTVPMRPVPETIQTAYGPSVVE